MARGSYEDALVEWALGRLAPPAALADPAASPAPPAAKAPGARGASGGRGARAASGKKGAAVRASDKAKPSAEPAPAARPSADVQLGRLRSLFALEVGEESALQLVLAAESPRVARRLSALSGGRGLLAWMVDEVAGAGLLSPSGRLRAHGLVVVDCLPGGSPSASDPVRLAPGMRERLAGQVPVPESMGLGLERISAADRGPLPEALAPLVKDDVLGTTARWTSVSGLPSLEADKLVAAMARRLARPALRIDGRAVARLSVGDAWALLAAARRETDLAESALLVDAAAWLGAGLLRALTAPALAVSRVVLCDERKVPDLAAPGGFTLRTLTLEASSSGAPSDGAPRPDQPGGAAAPPPLPPSIEAARRQAAVDAARAMGRPFDVPPLPPPAAVTSSPPPPQQQPPAVSAPAAAAVEPTPAAAAGRAPTPSPSPAASPEPELTMEERARRAAMFVGTAIPARRRAAAPPAANAVTTSAPVQPASAPEPPKAPGPAMAAPRDPGAEPAASSDTTAGAASLATGDPSESLPYLHVPESATLADLMRLVKEAANPFQKAALLRQLADAGVKDVSLMTLMRAYTTSSHPALRTAAEYGMLRLFGPSWNRTRAIPKPVQPPRPDDEKPQ